MKYYISVLKNYAIFTGRASRSEFWYFTLFNFIFSIITSLLDDMFGTRVDYDSSFNGLYSHTYTSMHYGYINMIYGLAVGKSGWFILLLFLPIIGWIWILILLCTNSEEGENKYGPNPYGIGNHSVDEIGNYLQE